MNKEEILEKSRKSNYDEGMEHAENQGRKIGYIVFMLLFACLVIFSLVFWQIGTLYAVASLFWVFMGVEAYAKYRFSKKKVYLVTAVAGSLASVCFVANYILEILR